MKLLNFIYELQDLYKEHGNLDVKRDGLGGAKDAFKPSIQYMKILSKRESVPRFWKRSYKEEAKGDKVVEI